MSTPSLRCTETVACPNCKRRKGQWCKNTRTGLSTPNKPHRARLKAHAELLRKTLQKLCKHTNETVHREGISGTMGTVVCLDCGQTRDWNAY